MCFCPTFACGNCPTFLSLFVFAGEKTGVSGKSGKRSVREKKKRNCGQMAKEQSKEKKGAIQQSQVSKKDERFFPVFSPHTLPSLVGCCVECLFLSERMGSAQGKTASGSSSAGGGDNSNTLDPYCRNLEHERIERARDSRTIAFVGASGFATELSSLPSHPSSARTLTHSTSPSGFQCGQDSHYLCTPQRQAV